MKTINKNGLLLVSAICLLTINSAFAQKDKTVIIKTELNCEECEEYIEENLSEIDGVKSYEFDLDKNRIIIKFDPLETTIELLRESISDAGFQADDIPGDEDAYKLLPDCCKKLEDQGGRDEDVEEQNIEIDKNDPDKKKK